MQHGFKIDRTLDFQPFMKSNSFAFLVTERTLSRFFHLIWVSLYCAAQYAKPCEACLSWRVVAALSAWNHSMPPCCEEGLPSPHPSPSYPITPRVVLADRLRRRCGPSFGCKSQVMRCLRLILLLRKLAGMFHVLDNKGALQTSSELGSPAFVFLSIWPLPLDHCALLIRNSRAGGVNGDC